jgi:hypothetical protein
MVGGWMGWRIGGPQRRGVPYFLSCSVRRRAERAGVRDGAANPVPVTFGPRTYSVSPLPSH